MCAEKIFEHERQRYKARNDRVARYEDKKHQSCLQLIPRLQQLVDNPVGHVGFLDTFCLGDYCSYNTDCSELSDFVNRQNSSSSPIKFKISPWGGRGVRYVETDVNLHTDTITYIVIHYTRPQQLGIP